MERITSAFGLCVLVSLAWLMSSARSKVSWRLVASGIALQFFLAAIILWTTPGRYVFESMGMFINTILGFVEDGAGFVLNLQQFPSDPPMPPLSLIHI
ncbi:MAG: hypothetical protein MPJ25_04825, partial [Pirellulales bacterium]|nr:hypothetical protein [Pirellulales bacterium]